MGQNSSGPSAHDIAQMLREHAEPLARMIFPAAVLAGGFLCVGSLQGEPGSSLKIQTRGPKRGTWADYATSDGDPQGKGDMLKLVTLTLGAGDIKRGIAEAKKYLNLDSMDPRALERMRENANRAQQRAERNLADDHERKRRNAEGLWLSADELTPSSPASRYLEGRGIVFGAGSPLARPPGSIRFHHAVSHKERGGKLPAMVTCFTGLDRQIKGVHLTFLEFRAGAGWTKLPDMELVDEHGEVRRVKVAKKIWGPLAMRGAHMPLWKGAQRCPLAGIKPGTAIEAAEGIEDGLSYAMANPLARIIGAGTLGNLERLELPPQAGTFTFLAQNDTDPKPIAAFEQAVKAQQQQARAHAEQHGGAPREVAERRPPQGVKDWNDWLRRAG